MKELHFSLVCAILIGCAAESPAPQRHSGTTLSASTDAKEQGSEKKKSKGKNANETIDSENGDDEDLIEAADIDPDEEDQDANIADIDPDAEEKSSLSATPQSTSPAPKAAEATSSEDNKSRIEQARREFMASINASHGPLHVEQTQWNTFTQGPNGCGAKVASTAFCDDRLCLMWQSGGIFPTPTDDQMYKSIQILNRYIELGSRIMNHFPSSIDDKKFKGRDGKTRPWVIELSNELCRGYGGAAYNGLAWNAIAKESFMYLAKTVNGSKPTVHQVFFYEMGRSLYDLKLDDILDWQMAKPEEYSYWTLGFNGAMTVLAPEALNLNMEYYGKDTAAFRRDRLQNLQDYINGREWTFDNAWSSYLMPWAEREGREESLNDMMSGLLITMSDQFGGPFYLSRLFYHLKRQPATPNKTDRKQRATNLYLAAKIAYQELGGHPQKIDTLFKTTLRWNFLP